MRTLITGGAGFIGSNLVDALLKRGDNVAVIDNLSTGKRENLVWALEQGATLHVGDVCDGAAMIEMVDRIEPVVIYHLAAQIDVRRSVADAALDARINVEGTINMLDAARRASVNRFVNVSSGGAIYGEPDRVPAPETAKIRPEAPYGQSKFAAEGYCELYRRLHRLSTVSLRFGNVYGLRQDPLREAGVIAIFCGCLADGKRPTVYGDGCQTRDYVYVEDIVTALLAAADADAHGSFNIGRGIETTVLELIAILAQHADEHNFTPDFAPPRPGEIQRIALDSSLAKRELGWRAEIGLSDGIARTLASLNT